MATKRKTMQQFEARADIAKALAHPTRLMLLDALQKNEMCVCDLTDLVGADQSTVSKHLAILNRAGLVAARKDGAMSFYRITFRCLDTFFECIENVLKANLKAQREAMGV